MVQKIVHIVTALPKWLKLVLRSKNNIMECEYSVYSP
jgi:hypothetical protein